MVHGSISRALLLILISASLSSACGPSQAELDTANTQAAAAQTANAPTLTNTPPPTPTLTPQPTPTATETYIPAPRWMLLAQPYFNIEILGETWEYYHDSWNASYACIRYQQDDYTRFFEQCFAIIDENTPTLTYEGILDPMLANGFEEIVPQTIFPNNDRISLSGMKKEENRVDFFEIIETQPYIFLVEMSVTVEEVNSLQEVYEEHAAEVMNYALLDSMQKSRAVPKPTSTPLSPDQQSVYDVFEDLLVTEQEAGEGWEALEDTVSKTNAQVCRDFELRVSVDVLWVAFYNCIFDLHPDFIIENVANLYQADIVVLESSHNYDGEFVIYGSSSGHFYFDAWLLQDGLLYLVGLESRVLAGGTIEDYFDDDVDDFLHKVLMINLDKSK